MEDLKQFIRDIPDFPTKGVVFKDITTLLKDARAFQRVIDLLGQRYVGVPIDYVAAIEARGFALAAPLAYTLGRGMILIRKPGKLPAKTQGVNYTLEYGAAGLEVHEEDIRAGDKILAIDDVLATGGTMRAVIDLIERARGEVVECCFLMELAFLHGRLKLAPHPVFALLEY